MTFSERKRGMAARKARRSLAVIKKELTIAKRAIAKIEKHLAVPPRIIPPSI